MGAPMAGHLARAGARLTVWNRTPGKAETLAEAGAEVAGSLGELGAACDAICLCVGRSEDVRECVRGLLETAREGALIIDHSTIAPRGARDLHELCAGRGVRFVDAPVTGGSAGAQQGRLTIFLGGDAGDVAEAQRVVAPYARRAERVGGPGAGQMMKLANQIGVAGALLGMCEALAFARKAGLDLAQTRDLLAGGAAGSWAFDNYGPKVLAGDWSPGFSIKNQRKDLGYCAEAAAALGAAIPGALLVDRLLGLLEADGRGEDATCALFEALWRLEPDA
jgi:3-hydroxyisobutyrate dehydrogenase-like beta-hydroxyacid dehydrogenase